MPMSSELSLPGLHLLDRRHFLSHLASGASALALLHLLAEEGRAADLPPIRPLIKPEAPLAARPPHFKPKAKRLLHIFCSGACSQLDTFDYKPDLVKRHGQKLPGEQPITFQGANGNLAKSPYAFRPRGKCGKWTSDLLPLIGECVDELCFIHSMTAKSNTHGPAEQQMNTGFTLEGFPSMGAWVSYALGTVNKDLPAFVAIPDPRGVPQIGPANWSSGFLPAVFQGTSFTAAKPIENLSPPKGLSARAEDDSKGMLRLLNEEHLKRHPRDTELAARISAYELAARMQLSAPAVSDLSKETKPVRDLYGADDSDPVRAGFARNCLLARRLLERGVRFVQVFNGAYAMGEGVGNWDGHQKLKAQYDKHGPILDRPVAALLKDLKARGLLDDTLVLWSTEFGRMPTFQTGAQGRDHNPKGFTVWLAGAGVKKGHSHGATDEFGYKAVEKVATIYDLHATILHLLGLDHQRLSFYHNGIERRLTDVHGHVIHDLLE
jgi:hypothetical protein